MRAVGLPEGPGMLRGASVEERMGLDRKRRAEQGVEDSGTVWLALLGGWDAISLQYVITYVKVLGC